jgi:hypothetical protein
MVIESQTVSRAAMKQLEAAIRKAKNGQHRGDTKSSKPPRESRDPHG